jgi:hypothetical protein
VVGRILWSTDVSSAAGMLDLWILVEPERSVTWPGVGFCRRAGPGVEDSSSATDPERSASRTTGVESTRRSGTGS